MDKTLYAGDTILTYSGHYINVFDPDPDHICIEDIAHGLSHVPRFAGQTAQFLSVAEHSCLVAGRVPLEYRLEALLHDATEAYLMDIPKPIKKHLKDYCELENRLMKAISEKFGIPFPISEIVKLADRLSLEEEHYSLRIRKPSLWVTLRPERAKFYFINTYNMIVNKEVKDA